jgi:hypothetical protein
MRLAPPDTHTSALATAEALLPAEQLASQAGTFENWTQVARQIVESVAGPQP